MPSAGVGILEQVVPGGIANQRAVARGDRRNELPLRRRDMLKGLAFTKESSGNEPTFAFLTKITAVGTPLATGITVELVTVDSVESPSAGLNAFFGISVKKLVSGTDTCVDTGFSTEVTQAVTSNATEGRITITTKAIATADADAPSAGDWVIVKLRRLSAHASDTHQGTILLLGLAVTDTATP